MRHNYRCGLIIRLLVCFIGAVVGIGCSAGSDSNVENAVGLDVAAPVVVEAEPGFEALGLGDFESFPAAEAGSPSWSERSGAIVCLGTKKGYLFSKKSHRNFVWRADFRFVSPSIGAESKAAEVDAQTEKKLGASNTGFMLHIAGGHKVWPASLEVQGKHAEMCAIKSNGGVAAVEVDDDASVRERVRRAVGQWNRVEIVSKDGAVTAALNGSVVCRSKPGALTEGLIGLQAEGYEVEFRNVRIKDE